MSEVFETERRKEALKGLIRMLHEGVSPEEAKDEFADVTTDVTPTELVLIEQELIQEGMPREEVMRLCDVHLSLFRDSIEAEGHIASPGHPVYILMEEHKALIILSNELAAIADGLSQAVTYDSKLMQRLDVAMDNVRNSESHYVREENVLFPYLEKHGITQPPAIMWMEHDQIRGIKRNLYDSYENREDMAPDAFARQLKEVAVSLSEMLESHFNKENSILFPTAMQVMEQSEWRDAKQQFDELGYCPFTPETARVSALDENVATSTLPRDGEVTFETGSLPVKTLQSLLNTLPVDITFVDKDDTVRYFSDAPHRIFARTKAIIGRTVQNCHPQKSVHVVNTILDDFKQGRREHAEFWLDLHGRKVHIRYFAVRDLSGQYLGCLEVTQDVTEIQKLLGQKRLLDG